MENYTVRFTVSIDINTMANNPDEAYDIAEKTATMCLNAAYNNVSIIDSAVFDESGSRVD